MSRCPLLAVALALVVTTTAASALTLDAVTLAVGGRRGDSFRVKGRFASPPTFVAPDAVVVRFDRAVLRLPIGDFARRKATLTYRSTGGAGLLSSLRLDTRRGRFAMAGKGWALASLSNPLPIAVGTDTVVDCGMALLADRGRGKRRKLRLARGA
ncbi:MAG TPA: hypothetical protein VGR62_23490, partial [Candidatus Binatia bacterium]|nr:hypothetical protein [Candidatus Binatia bacterium]